MSAEPEEFVRVINAIEAKDDPVATDKPVYPDSVFLMVGSEMAVTKLIEHPNGTRVITVKRKAAS